MAWVKIKDYHSIESLADALSSTGSAMSQVVEEFTNYLQQCLEEVAGIKAEVESAKDSLYQQMIQAQEDLESCESSQWWDEERGRYVPSCNAEKSQYRRARDAYDRMCQAYEYVSSNLKECEWQMQVWMGDTIPTDPMSVIPRVMALPLSAMEVLLEPTSGYQIAQRCADLCQEGEMRLSRIAQHCENYSMIQLVPGAQRIDAAFVPVSDDAHAGHFEQDIGLEGSSYQTRRCVHGYIKKKCPLCKLK